jgi:hypothetical protein
MENRCPECGQGFDPEDAGSYGMPGPPPLTWQPLALLLAVIVGLLMAGAFSDYRYHTSYVALIGEILGYGAALAYSLHATHTPFLSFRIIAWSVVTILLIAALIATA